MKAALDHLVIGGSDLGLLVAWWKQQSGTDAARGGQHIGFGTRNALIGVDESTYVELISHDPEQAEPAQPRPFGLDNLEPNSIQLATFVMAVSDIKAAVAAVRAVGLDPGVVTSMSRTRGDGVQLEWQLAIPPEQGMKGTLPALIQWGDDIPHPGSNLDPTVSVEEVVLGHTEPGPLQAALVAIGSDLVVNETPKPMLAAHFVAGDRDFWL